MGPFGAMPFGYAPQEVPLGDCALHPEGIAMIERDSQANESTDNTRNDGLLIRAVAFAADKHRNQRRKDAEASPYINHPIALAGLLAIEGGI